MVEIQEKPCIVETSFIKKINPDTQFINYTINSHGSRIEDDYIELPPGIRVVALCTDSSCPIDTQFDARLMALMMDDNKETMLTPELKNFDEKLYGRYAADVELFNACVYSGNIDDKFNFYGCDNKKINIVPNMKLGREEKYFVSGIYKMPVRIEMILGEDTLNSTATKFIVDSYVEKTMGRDYRNILLSLIRPKDAQRTGFVMRYLSDYVQIGSKKAKTGEIPNILTLRDAIEYIMKKEDFDATNCMITIIISACMGSSIIGEEIPDVCMIRLDDYSTQQISYIEDQKLYTGLTLSEYDVTMANDKSRRQQNGGAYYYHKYIKYKRKYLSLKGK